MLLMIIRWFAIILIAIAVLLHFVMIRRRRPGKLTLPTIVRGMVGIITLVVSLYYLASGLVVSCETTRLAGWITICLGLALRIWAQLELGSSWSVGVCRGEKLATSGPYKFLRHPMYDAYVIIGVGVITLTQSVLLTFLWGFFWIQLFQRALRESELMAESFPEEFWAWLECDTMLFLSFYRMIRCNK